MTLDEWVDLIKGIGPDAFKGIGVAFLRERFERQVQYTDGKGDGGVDAWIVDASEPLVRRAAQFYAGGESWTTKVTTDVEKMTVFRDSLAPDNPKRQDFNRLYFVCTQEPAFTLVESLTDQLLKDSGVRVDIFDARAIASLSMKESGELWRLLAQRLPGFAQQSEPRSSARDEALLAFSFFHDQPNKFRRAVAKSAVTTVLHQQGGSRQRDVLLDESAQLLRVTPPSRLVEHAVRDLASEGLVVVNESALVVATQALTDSTKASLALAGHEMEALRKRCLAVLEPRIAKGAHRRAEVAARAVDALLRDLGLLVQQPIAEEIIYSMDPSKLPRNRYEREAVKRWRKTAERLTDLLTLDDGGHALLLDLVRTIASDPFAHRLAAAELFLQLTEHDAGEFASALSVSGQHVLLDATIAMPMMCALYDEPIRSWKTSFAAHELHASLSARAVPMFVAEPHLEEMAAHLLKARTYAEVIDSSDVDLSRSTNFFVAHFCALNARNRSKAEFLFFLARFGLPTTGADAPFETLRVRVETSQRKILERYQIQVESIETVHAETPLPGEPRRDLTVLRHDRAVVRSLLKWSRKTSWLVCSADTWLRGVLADSDIIALDAVGLSDLLALVRPHAAARSLLSPIELAGSIFEQEKEAAAAVWDTIVQLEGPNLRDGALVERAREFRSLWLASRRELDADVGAAWARFRNNGTLSDPTT